MSVVGCRVSIKSLRVLSVKGQIGVIESWYGMCGNELVGRHCELCSGGFQKIQIAKAPHTMVDSCSELRHY